MKKDPFNNPFKGLKLNQDKPAAPAKAAPRPAAAPASKKPVAASEEEALFLEAMAGVEQLPTRPSEPQRSVPAPAIPRTSEEAESLAQLAELVLGQGELDISDSDELIEGGAPDLDRRVLKALRKGDYALQGRLDLHGMTQPQAKEAVEAFLLGARRDGKRCVLIVHGKGLNSADQIPVLKAQLKGWLARGRVSKSVLAFTSARPQDGGTGALYVLLRR